MATSLLHVLLPMCNTCWIPSIFPAKFAPTRPASSAPPALRTGARTITYSSPFLISGRSFLDGSIPVHMQTERLCRISMAGQVVADYREPSCSDTAFRSSGEDFMHMRGHAAASGVISDVASHQGFRRGDSTAVREDNCWRKNPGKSAGSCLCRSVLSVSLYIAPFRQHPSKPVLDARSGCSPSNRR